MIIAIEAGAPLRAAPLPAIPLRHRVYGFGSIYGKTIRDSRLALLLSPRPPGRGGRGPGGVGGGSPCLSGAGRPPPRARRSARPPPPPAPPRGGRAAAASTSSRRHRSA